jgi:hypothetical protein
MISDDQRRISAEHAEFNHQQLALPDSINWVHQPAFDKAFADLTGTEPQDDEWRRQTNWNFTADDGSFT